MNIQASVESAEHIAERMGVYKAIDSLVKSIAAIPVKAEVEISTAEEAVDTSLELAKEKEIEAQIAAENRDDVRSMDKNEDAATTAEEDKDAVVFNVEEVVAAANRVPKDLPQVDTEVREEVEEEVVSQVEVEVEEQDEATILDQSIQTEDFTGDQLNHVLVEN